MKKMRKLLPAFAMLLVSAIMMSTASFAWFTMSASVTAEGLTVKAQAAGGLVMSAAKAGATPQTPGVNDYAANIDFGAATWYTNGAKNLFPTSTDTVAWYTASGDDVDSNAAADGTYEKLDATGITNNNQYYLATTLYFKAITEGYNHELLVSDVNVTATNANLDKALRVAMNIGDDWYFFAPNYDTAGELHFTTTTGDPATFTLGDHDIRSDDNEDGNMIIGSDFDGVLLASNLTSDTPLAVDVYIYYEGEDENCKSAFTVDVNTLEISLSFTIGAATAIE